MTRKFGQYKLTQQWTYRIPPDTPSTQIQPRHGGRIVSADNGRVIETATPIQKAEQAARMAGQDAVTVARTLGRGASKTSQAAFHVGGRMGGRVVRGGLSQLRAAESMGDSDVDGQVSGFTHRRARGITRGTGRTGKRLIGAPVKAGKAAVRKAVEKRLHGHKIRVVGVRSATQIGRVLGRNARIAGGAMGSSIRDGGQLDVDQASVRVMQHIWRRSTGVTGRAGMKIARPAMRLGARHAARAGRWAGRHLMTATVQATVVTVKALLAALGAATSVLPTLVGIIAIVAVLCAILPSFITGVGAEQQRRKDAEYARSIACSGPGSVTAEDVAKLLPSPRGTDISGSLTEEQRATATAIVEEGQKAGIPPRGWAIALMTAMQESTMGADPATKKPNQDGDVGVFQQRAIPGWYADGSTMEENTEILNDVHYAAKTFYLGHKVAVRYSGGAGDIGYHIPGLVNVEGWQSMDLGQAAQKVQVSAFPDHYGKHEATVAALLPTLSPQGCAAAGAPGSSGLAGKDDYGPWYAGLPDMVKSERYDPNGFAWRQCTSYAAFAVRTYSSHKDFNNWWRQDGNFGNANTWHLAARKAGIRVDHSPAVGAVAQRTTGQWGHVAYVVEVNDDGSFVVNEYNRNDTREFSSRTARVGKGSSDFDNFLHFEEG
ncbi:CHAP domain-containing protein [Arachnia propionica]|nr:CHAP domain-containing protein [Arachnia propionica]